MTSPFARHGITHLSASSVNLFAADQALWVAERLLNRRAPVGAAAHRGSAIEAGVTYGLQTGDLDGAIKEAEKTFAQKAAFCRDPRMEKERAAIKGTVESALKELAPYGPGVVCQQKIEWQPEGLSVPFIGFVDFYWPHSGVLTDLKTQLQLANKIKPSHARQLALYTSCLGDNVDARITYATPHKAHSLGLENTREHLECLVNLAKKMERILARHESPWDLVDYYSPNVDSFYYNDPQTRDIAFEIYGI